MQVRAFDNKHDATLTNLVDKFQYTVYQQQPLINMMLH